jgi:CRP-like cAMP-binding protein
VLHRRDERPDRVYFPAAGLGSVVVAMKDGLNIEVAMIGAEGTTGVLALPSPVPGSVEIRTHVADPGMQSMRTEQFRQEMSHGGAFAAAVERYQQAFLHLTLQTCACYGLHGVDERCCRWLLMTHDRIGTNVLPITQDAIAAALGVRRPTITITINALRRAGLVGQGHGKIVILNRAGLEMAACECYEAIRKSFGTVLAA